MSVGEELRQARQQAGLSPEQVSHSTKIQLAKLEALEQNAFERLPQGIYLDGIVRAYARAVHLDGDALVQRIRADVALPENRTPATTAPEVPVSLIAFSDDPSAYNELDAFPPESDMAHDPVPVAAHDPVPVAAHGPVPVAAHDPAPVAAHDPVPVAAHDPVPVAARSGDDLVLRDDASVESTVSRRSPLPFALAVIALLGAFGWGGYLYESSRRSAAAQGAGELAAAGAHGATASAKGAPGAKGAPQDTRAAETRQAGPDNGSTDTRPPEGSTPEAPVGRGEKVAQGPRASAAPEAPAPSALAQRSTMPGEPAPATRDAPGGTSAGVAPGAPGSPAPATDVSGVWTLDTRIESSSYRDYEGLQLGYHLQLQQDGSRVSGTGVKTVENGRRLGSTAQTPILIEGSISGARLTLTFIERGLRRTTDGKMILDVNDDGVLRGRFSSTAAQSAGLVEARRTQS